MKTSTGCDDQSLLAVGTGPSIAMRVLHGVARSLPCAAGLVIMAGSAYGQNLAVTAPRGSNAQLQKAQQAAMQAQRAAQGQTGRARTAKFGRPAQLQRQRQQTPTGANSKVARRGAQQSRPRQPSASTVSGVGGNVRQATATSELNSNQVRTQIDAVYQAASEASTVADIMRALTACESLKAQPLDQDNQAYLQQLQGWLLNRRGEAYSQAAGNSTESGQHETALTHEQQAQSDFEQSLQLHPHWRAYHNLGVSLAMTGEYELALQNFSRAIELNPNYASTRFNRAELMLELGKYEAAEVEYSNVLKLNPDDADALTGRGHSRFYLAKFEEALQDFDEVIQRQPENSVALADRADLNAYLANWSSAASDYMAAIRLDPEQGRAYQSAAWLMATCPDEAFRNDALAVQAAEKAIALDGTEDYRYLDTLAAAQANAGEFQQAVQTLQQVIGVAPDDVAPELQRRSELYQASQPYRDALR